MIEGYKIILLYYDSWKQYHATISNFINSITEWEETFAGYGQQPLKRFSGLNFTIPYFCCERVISVQMKLHLGRNANMVYSTTTKYTVIYLATNFGPYDMERVNPWMAGVVIMIKVKLSWEKLNLTSLSSDEPH